MFCLPEELLAGCSFSYLDVSQPVALSALGTEERPGEWRAYADACCAALLRETRDRPRGWVAVNADDPGVELAFRKVGYLLVIGGSLMCGEFGCDCRMDL